MSSTILYGKKRLKILLEGAVQGMGFRPFVRREALSLGLTGWVANSPEGAVIEAEGPEATLYTFLFNLKENKPPFCSIHRLKISGQSPAGDEGFLIRDSQALGDKQAWILPDIASCGDCLREISDPADRRYQYPFTNCTHCGPRYTVLEELPYDRAHTTMKDFKMCPYCAAEYADPQDRRFHAQPNACPECGPQLELWDGDGTLRETRSAALDGAADLLRAGKIVAIKGLGGFHLAVDATNEEAVRLLRCRKRREEKPLAVMMQSVSVVRKFCELSAAEELLLVSPEAPIVLLKKIKSGLPVSVLAPSVAPGNPYLGAFLPYTPLHWILLQKFKQPLVMTSGNLSDEPIVTDNREALLRLGAIADCYLVHNRRIARAVDDSVVRVILGEPQILRRARGYAPLSIAWKKPGPRALCVGAHLKSTIAQSSSEAVFLSPHIGDLDSEESRRAFRKTADVFAGLYESEPEFICTDLHPDYYSTQFAARKGKPVLAVQHHYAHILSCMAEQGLEGPLLGVAWDGTGLGDDGTLWGGEFLRIDESSFQRVASFRPFCLPGSERAIREGRRSALGLLYAMGGEALLQRQAQWALRHFSKEDMAALMQMLSRGLHCPRTSSAGRLFDAVASLLEIRQISSFEGQSAIELEFKAQSCQTDEAYEAPLICSPETTDLWVYDWEPAVRGLLEEKNRGVDCGLLAAKFHNTLAEAIVAAAQKIGEKHVVLSGGCFQNRILLERTVKRLQDEGFSPHWHHRVPTHDGGIALGQAEAARRLSSVGALIERTVASCA